jgi:hypothetical protein
MLAKTTDEGGKAFVEVRTVPRDWVGVMAKERDDGVMEEKGGRVDDGAGDPKMLLDMIAENEVGASRRV